MRLLQRYLLVELLRVFTFVLIVLTVLLVFVGVMREVTENGLGAFQVLQILPYVVPSLLPFTIPATLLLTVCVVYGRVSGDLEITAAKAAGINVLSLLWPSFWLGAVLALFSLVLTDQVIPWAVGNIQRTVTAAMEDIFLDMLRTHHHVIDRERGYSITVLGVRGKTLLLPVFQYRPPGRRPVTLQAKEATLDFDLEKQQVMLHLVRGRAIIAGQQYCEFEREDRPFPLPHQINKPKPRHLSIRDIRRDMNSLRQDQEQTRQHCDVETALALAVCNFDRFLDRDFTDLQGKIDYDRCDLAKLNTEVHSRFALSSSCLFFALLGGPFSILQGRRQFLTSFFLCFLPILLVYYPVFLLMMNLSKMGTVSPAWSMWLANVLMLVVAVWVLRRALRH